MSRYIDGVIAMNSSSNESSQVKLGLVIPTLNEAGNIPILVRRLHSALADVPVNYEILVVDDDSQDGTAEAARKEAELDPRVRT